MTGQGRWKARSLRLAVMCERGEHARTFKCRCGGALYGARRPERADAAHRHYDAEFFTHLPDDDPHRIPTVREQERLVTARLELRAARRERALHASRWSASDEERLWSLYREVRQLEWVVLGEVRTQIADSPREAPPEPSDDADESHHPE